MVDITVGLSEFYEKKKYVDLKNVFEMLNECRYAVVKGVPLKILTGGDVTALYSDVDILTDRNTIELMHRALNENNYYNDERRESRIFALTSTHQMMPYSLIYNVNQKVDINFDLFWGEYEGERINVDEFLADTVKMDIYGIKVKTLPPIKQMIQLILHNYKDMNSIFLLSTRNSIKYDMFSNVYCLLKNNLGEIPLDKFYRMCREYRIIPYVFYLLYYTGQIFNDKVLNQYIDAFCTPEGLALLNCYGLCVKERKEWRYDFKTRLETDNLYELIKDDLTITDRKKIALNKRIFLRDNNDDNYD